MKKFKIIIIILLLTTSGFYFYFQKGSWFSPAQIYAPANELKQADTLLIKISGPLAEEKIFAEFASKKIDFSRLENSKNQIAIIGINVKERPGKYGLILNFSNGKKIEKEINIIKREFPTTEILVTKELEKRGYTPSKIIKNTAKENSILNKIIGVYTSEPYFNQAFIYPLKDIKNVGAFGTIKKTGNSLIQHLGVDLDAKIGTPVLAINDGLVSFSQELTDYGKILIIDHGLGIFSFYLHLDKFNVLSGDLVKRGDIIAFSGNTGYSIAPHLHFSIKLNGASVDPLKFIETTKNLDK